MEHRDITQQIIGGAIEVHRHWGPGLYEEIYHRSLCHELRLRGLTFESEFPVPLVYKGEDVGDALRVDLLVGGAVVVELKAVSELLPVHEAQLLTYMRLTRCRVGLLVNFNVAVLRNGVRRLVL